MSFMDSLPTIVLWLVIIGFIVYGWTKLKPQFKDFFSSLKQEGQKPEDLTSEIKKLQDKINNQKQINKLQADLDNLKRQNL